MDTERDNLQMVADAKQWNFLPQTIDASAFLAPPMKKVIFLRGGTQWTNVISIDLGIANYPNLQLSFRDNTATRGDFAGTYPVIDFSHAATPFTGNVDFSVVLKTVGRVSMVLRGIDNGAPNLWSLFEMEWVIVP